MREGDPARAGDRRGRLEALSRLNLGAWTTVPSPVEFDRADEEFAAGYELSIQDDPPLAGMFMVSAAPSTTRARTSERRFGGCSGPLRAGRGPALDLALGLREPDAVLLHQLGQVHRHLGHPADARAWFEETIALSDADQIPVRRRRAPPPRADPRGGLFDEALSFARSAEQVLAQARDVDQNVARDLAQTLARLEASARAS